MAATTARANLPVEVLSTPEEKPWQITVRRFRRHRMAMVSLGIVLAVFLVSLLARQVATFPPSALTVGDYFLPFGAVDAETGRVHYLGTDNIGRDYFTRLVYAGRISLSVAFLSMAISTLLGVTVGAYAGYYGGWVDAALMRLVEFLLTIPALPLLLIISSILLRNENALPIPTPMLTLMGRITLLDPRDARQAIVIVMVLAGLGWLTTARLMRGMVLALREQPFVEAARALGANNAYIIFRHMVPNAMAPVIVQASLDMAGFLVAEASLSFLGFGIQDPIPTWGNMLAGTQQFMFDRAWLPLVPGTPIFLCSLAFNFIGDGLRDALDPRLKM
jgi:peptide/nickel transport system permease protein